MCECRSPIHDHRCPDYEPVSTGKVCFYCGEPIALGEQYVGSEIGNTVHAECFDCMNIDETFDFFGEVFRLRSETEVDG